ncbi:hypothetical protein BDQ17DRAFT_847538 [Cyathus striatus]|nr:hypothetical protein BDQ17DRAFT_847538 [Cyathus striatus]
MHSFDQASNFAIYGLNQTDIRIDSEKHKEKAFERLQKGVVSGASHDAGERYDAPKCHPETRKAVMINIKSWIVSDNKTTRIMWLYGPAGAGKSAIAQTTAEDCHGEGKLAASFFFSRFAAGRNKKGGLVATIAFQLCISIPEMKEYIIKNIEKNPSIFKTNIKTQMQSLVIEPFSLLNQVNTSTAYRRLIIIDGLDECEIRKDQVEIIKAIAESLSMDRSSRLRVLLVSRPEVEIRQAFNEDNISSMCTRLALDDTFDPDKDIDIFLRSHFQALKRHHDLRSILVSWPSDEIIHRIVQKSSGQFIYASTVIHYISDPRQNPQKRLNTVLDTTPANGEMLFAQLDALYSTILSVCEDYQKVALVLEAIMFLNIAHGPVSGGEILKSVHYLDAFLSLENESLLLLADLHSIVDVNDIPNTGIRFYHASLYDFLQDSSRSHQFYIDRYRAHARFSLFCLNHVINTPSGLPDDVYTYSLGCCFCHFNLSNYDHDVLGYICNEGCIKSHSQLQNAIQKYNTNKTYWSQLSSHSVLGHMIRNGVDEREKYH